MISTLLQRERERGGVESFFALIKGLMASCKYLLSAFGGKGGGLTPTPTPTAAARRPKSKVKQTTTGAAGEEGEGRGITMGQSHVAPLDVAVLH